MTQDTIVALSSGALPSGIAVVRTSGPDAMAAARRIAGPLPEPRYAALRKFTDPADGTLIDRGLLLTFPGPGTATGEDLVEYHCHGGRATVAALLRALQALPGLRAANPGEFTRRALANGIIDLTAAEGLADLLEAETELQRKVALNRSEGAVRRAAEDVRDSLVSLSAAAELAIDYVEEEEEATAAALPKALIQALEAQMADLVDRAPVESLRNGVRVVVAGPPNAGKSSLVNALAGTERAIVTDVAGTTRDTIEVPLAIDGIPLVLIDTAGLRTSDDVVEQIGIARAGEEVERADIVLWMGDSCDTPEGAVLIAGKCDLNDDRPGLPFSSLTGAGREAVIAEIVRRAKHILPTSDRIALTERERSLFRAAISELQASSACAAPEIMAEHLRRARDAVGQVTGHADVEALLDALFSRFCVGK